MELSILERMLILSLLSNAEGNITLLRTVREHQERIGFTDKELEALNFRKEGTQTLWEKSADVPIEVEIGKPVADYIATRLKQLSDQSKLSLTQLALYEKFNPPEDLENDV